MKVHPRMGPHVSDITSCSGDAHFFGHLSVGRALKEWRGPRHWLVWPNLRHKIMLTKAQGCLAPGGETFPLEKEIPSSPLDKYFLLCSCKDTPSAESPLSSITLLRKLAVVQSNKTSRRFLFHCSPDGILFFRQPHRLWPYSFFTVKHLFIFIAYSYSCCFCLSRQPKHATSWMARSQQTTAHAGRTMPTHLVAEHSLPASANQTCALNPADSASQPMA
jgi:hypothetical protein